MVESSDLSAGADWDGDQRCSHFEFPQREQTQPWFWLWIFLASPWLQHREVCTLKKERPRWRVLRMTIGDWEPVALFECCLSPSGHIMQVCLWHCAVKRGCQNSPGSQSILCWLLEYCCCRGSLPSTATTWVAVGATPSVRSPDHFCSERCRFEMQGKKGTEGKNKAS